MAEQFDLVVIGSGPGGQRAAIQATGTGLLRDKRVIRRDVTIAELSAATRDVP